MAKVFSVLVALTVALVSFHANSVVRGDAPTLQSIFDEDNIHAYFPGQPGYPNASSSFNLRLPYQPAAIAYPTTTGEVAQVIRAGASLGIPGEISTLLV